MRFVTQIMTANTILNMGPRILLAPFDPDLKHNRKAAGFRFLDLAVNECRVPRHVTMTFPVLRAIQTDDR